MPTYLVEKKGTIFTSRCKAIGMPLYSWRWWKPRWKDPRTFNAETQAHAYANGLGVREGIRPRRSCRFGLDGLDAWQGHWWRVNPWNVNWHLQAG
jgi:hypothetical protein